MGSKLSAAQTDLLECMRRGNTVYYLSGLNAYYFRSDTMKNCTKQAVALLGRGLVERHDIDWKGCKLRLIAESRSEP